MIAILLEDVPFEQDIRELCMAFFPGEIYVHEADADASLTVRGWRDVHEIYRLRVTDKAGYCREGAARILDDRFQTKCLVKTVIYHILENYTGHGLPWGTLTGIRPTRLFLDMLDEGMSEDEASDEFRNQFEPSVEKLALCREVAVREKKLLETVDTEKGWSLYLGIPFCPTTCLYCSFTSYPISAWKNRTQEYVDALIEDVRRTAEQYKGRRLETIYMGGGTPTSLEADQLKRILEAVFKFNDVSCLKELTVEAGRPDSITREKLMALRQVGCDRISVNPQTMRDETLKAIGRLHTVDMVREKFHLARECGFENINMDIIAGLPGENASHMEMTMRELEKLAPDSITVHTLAIKHKSRLNRESASGAWADEAPGADAVADMLHIADTACRNMGLSPYYMYRQKNMAGNFENVGYSLPGKECLYNVLIMEERQTIAGCGAGTSTKIPLGRGQGVERSAKVRDPGIYIERFHEI